MRIPARVPGLCDATLAQHFVLRRIRAAIAVIIARVSRLRNLVVRQSLLANEFAPGERDAQPETIEGMSALAYTEGRIVSDGLLGE